MDEEKTGEGTGTGTTATTTTAETAAGTVARKRIRRKPAFAMPPPAWPVKGLWEAASEEERLAAHRMGTLLFEHWLGRISRKELAAKIGQPPVRVWQLSQQALAGLVVGLLKQPAKPPKGTPLPPKHPLEEDPRQLRKALQEAERRNAILEDLVRVLKEFPNPRPAPPGTEPEAGARRKPGRPKGKKNLQVPARAGRVAPSEPGAAPAS